jgi:subtilase family serine protease
MPDHPAARRRPRVEELEPRRVPSGASLVAVPAAAGAPLAAASTTGLTPAQVRHAYGFDRLAGDGAGQTIALVTAYDHPFIVQDLAAFSRRFGLPDPPSFVKATPQGTPPTDALWALEASLDVQWAHAVAPRANLLLVEARSASVGDLLAAADYARRQPGVTVVSMSWGVGEFSAQTFYEPTFTAPPGSAGVAFVAASGDGGASTGPLWPAVSPNVLAVGGTQLVADPSGNRVSEDGWPGSGGGTSRHVAAPSAQAAVTGRAWRSTPDVAYHASRAIGFAVYCSVPVNGLSGWLQVGGTSAGAPQWAGLLALANQARAASARPPVANAVAAVYGLGTGAFFDVTTGSNGHSAGPGYDLVTGRGAPVADRVVSGLGGEPAKAPPTFKLNLGSIAAKVTDFLKRATGRAAAVNGAIRLPSGPGMALDALVSMTADEDSLRSNETD